MHSPVHPGGFIRTEIIEAHGLSVTATKVLGVSRPALSNLLNQNADLSGEMALRIEQHRRIIGLDVVQRCRQQPRSEP
jgi:addiction module HigA family antidote